MTRNLARQETGAGSTPGMHTAAAQAGHAARALAGRSLVLVGLMGAGKTSVGRRLAQRLGLPFRDADAEIERAAGCSIPELFARYGERAFREGERRVISRLLAEGQMVLSTGGGAWMDDETRARLRAGSVSVWLRCCLPTLVRRVTTRGIGVTTRGAGVSTRATNVSTRGVGASARGSARGNRPLLQDGDPAEILRRLMLVRHPIYAEANLVVDSGDDALEVTVTHVIEALLAWREPTRLPVALAGAHYDVVIGENLLERAGSLLGPVLPQRRAVVVTDEHVAALHLPTLLAGLAAASIETSSIVVPPGEASKSLDAFGRLTEALLAAGVERGTTVIGFGGGVIGDLAGFAAATTLRGLPFVQVPTSLLAQVDSSVGGKTGINSAHGKNLVGAFYQPRCVLADIAVLASLPIRELRCGYAEVVKAGLIADHALFAWCEANASALLGGQRSLLAEAVQRACAFKAAVVGDDEREEKPSDGRALLNLGHTFAHALEAECRFDGTLLHGEAVAIGLGLAFSLSVRLGLCAPQDEARVLAHLDAAGLPASIAAVGRPFSAASLVGHMRRDKKMRDGKLAFVLVRGIGQAFTTRSVPPDEVTAALREAGCDA